MVVSESLEGRDIAYPVLRGEPAALEAFAVVPLPTGAVLYLPVPGGLEAAARAHVDRGRRQRLRHLTKSWP